MTRIKDALDAVAAAIIAQKDYLTDLDRQIADGDHGSTWPAASRRR